MDYEREIKKPTNGSCNSAMVALLYTHASHNGKAKKENKMNYYLNGEPTTKQAVVAHLEHQAMEQGQDLEELMAILKRASREEDAREMLIDFDVEIVVG